jgi:hypothetical protein
MAAPATLTGVRPVRIGARHRPNAAGDHERDLGVDSPNLTDRLPDLRRVEANHWSAWCSLVNISEGTCSARSVSGSCPGISVRTSTRGMGVPFFVKSGARVVRSPRRGRLTRDGSAASGCRPSRGRLGVRRLVFAAAFRRRRAWIAGKSPRQLCASSGARWSVVLRSPVSWIRRGGPRSRAFSLTLNGFEAPMPQRARAPSARQLRRS